MRKKLKFVVLSGILLASTGAMADSQKLSDLENYAVWSGAALSISADSSVTNWIGAEGAIAVGARSKLYGPVYSLAAVEIGASTVVRGPIIASAAVNTGASSEVEKEIHAGAAVAIGANGRVAGDIVAGAASSIGAEAQVMNIYSGAAVSLGAGSSSKMVRAGAAISGGGATGYYPYADMSESLKTLADVKSVNGIELIASAQAALFNINSPYTNWTAGSTLTSGVYAADEFSMAANETITFDGRHDQNSKFIINIAGNMTLGAGASIRYINSARPGNIIWNVGGALDLGAGSYFRGRALVAGAVTGAISEVHGSVWAIGAVSLNRVFLRSSSQGTFNMIENMTQGSYCTPRAIYAPTVGRPNHDCYYSLTH
jgi:predicted acyltransferase (DUF342 family)